jgi:beta-glucosidase
MPKGLKILIAAGVLVGGISADGKATHRSVPASQWTAQQSREITAWPRRKSANRPNPAFEKRIAAIVAGMTLEQKVGQMTQPSIRSITPDEVRKYDIGSVLNGGGSWPNLDKHASVADWAKLSDEFSRASLSSDMKVPVPLIWGTDAVHGHNNVYGATIYPHNIGLGAAHDPMLLRRIGEATGKAVRATGINWAFAPTLAVVQNQRWGRAYESFSSDPAEVARDGSAIIRGLQGSLKGDGNVLATAKHFVGDGGTHLGIDQGENQASAAQLATVHGKGYYAALDAGVQTVMVSYNSLNQGGLKPLGKMHGNAALITGVLKQRLGFDGLVVSDWNAIEQVQGCERDRCVQSVNAGIDLFMVPDDWKAFIAKTVADVRSGAIPMARIDDAVTRILRVKFRMGLFDRPTSAGRFNAQQDAVSNRALGQEAVRKSAVLLKNYHAALPLSGAKHVLVVGGGADSFPEQVGGWSITWQGDEIDNADFPIGETLLGGLRRIYGSGNVTYSKDGQGVDPGRYDAVVAVLGETPHAEMKGDVRFPALLSHSARYPEQLALLDRVKGKGTPVITVLYSGRTVYATDLINRSDAFVAGFLPGTEAGAIADLIAGKSKLDFTARLSFAWPGTPCPASGERKVDTLFERGYGLSYRSGKSTGSLPEAAQIATCP